MADSDVKQVTIEEFKNKFIQTGIDNGLPEHIVNKLEYTYRFIYNKYTQGLPYKANEILQHYVTNSVINIKVSLINVLQENSNDDDPWVQPMSDIIQNYRVA